MADETPSDNPPAQMRASIGEILAFALLVPLLGMVVGLVVELFRMALERVSGLRTELLTGISAPGIVLALLAGGAMVALSVWIVRRFAPEASGSGIPRVQDELAGKLPPAGLRVVPVKFLAGVLAFAPGLALGREGPSVQIGASIGWNAARRLQLSEAISRNMLAACAGAGFAAAFGAPLAAALFVMEALLKRFDARAMLAALAASAGAVWVGHLMSGAAPEITVPPLHDAPAQIAPLYLLLGLIAGLVGVVYERIVLRVLDASGRMAIPVTLRAALIGAAVMAIAIAAPQLVGPAGGMTLALDGSPGLGLLPVFLLLRMALIAVSVAARTPGGLLIPILSLGADLGMMFGLICALALPSSGIEPHGFALVGMAALFAAIVRTPLTAIMLIPEMTGDTVLILPLVMASFAAMLFPILLGYSSILDALRRRLPRRRRR